MLFKETWQQVLDGTKTQTRRPVKTGDQAVKRYRHSKEIERVHANTLLGRRFIPRWKVGNTYAVQPGRGKPAIWLPPGGAPIDDPLAEYIRKTESVRATWGPKVKEWLRTRGYQEARIRITKIRRERLQKISLEDCEAEGALSRSSREFAHLRWAFAELWNSLYHKPYRWEDNPEVWCLSFELAEQQDALA